MLAARRWISSMNRTSRGSRLVRIAARSPALASTGPLVARKLTPSSRATIWARVVLPRPGGPNSSTWSSASWRPRAASMNTLRLALIGSWPTNSLKVCGRIERSALSSSAGSPETSLVILLRSWRSYGGPVLRSLGEGGPVRRSSLGSVGGSSAQLLQRRLDHRRDVGLVAKTQHGLLDHPP